MAEICSDAKSADFSQLKKNFNTLLCISKLMSMDMVNSARINTLMNKSKLSHVFMSEETWEVDREKSLQRHQTVQGK